MNTSFDRLHLVNNFTARALAVPLLEPDHRSVELPLGPALATFDPAPPGQLLDRAQRQEGVEPGVAAVTTGVGPSGPYAGRVDEEGPEEPVDVVGRPRGPGSGRAVVVRRDQPVDGRLDDGVLVRGEPARNAATLRPPPRPSFWNLSFVVGREFQVPERGGWAYHRFGGHHPPWVAGYVDRAATGGVPR